MSSLTVSDAATASRRERQLQNLKSDEVRLLFRVLNTMSATTDLHAFRREVSEDLLRLLKADFLASYIWDQESQVFGNFVGLNSDPANVERYLSYYQFHDPITPSLRVTRKATLVREVISREELEKTEFFNDFLMKDGQHHGMNLHAYEGDLEIGDLRIWRTKKRPDFGDHEAAVLDAILPYFRNALLNARTIARVRGIDAFWTQLLENTHVGVLIFDETGRLVYRNKETHTIEHELPQGKYCLLVHLRRSRREGLRGTHGLGSIFSVRPENSPAAGFAARHCGHDLPALITNRHRRAAAHTLQAYTSRGGDLYIGVQGADRPGDRKRPRHCLHHNSDTPEPSVS